MRNFVFGTIFVLPLLVGLAQAGQNWNFDSTQPFGIPSEDSGNSYLGVDIADITSDRLGALKLKEEQGVEVTMVDQDAPAGKAGLKEHDVILSMNGTTVESKTQLQRMIHETPAGRVISLGLSRDGQPLTVKVQLADRKSEFHHLAKSKDGDFHFEMPQMPVIPNMPDFDVPNVGVVVVHSSVRSGLMVENLTPQLGEFFGAKNGTGVLVRSVEKGSRADKAGLRAGDVVIRVGDQFIHDTSDFTHAMHSRSAGSVNLDVIRDRKQQTLTISLPDRKDSGGMIEESLDDQELNAESQIELSEVRDEIANLRPQIELAVHGATAEAQKQMSQVLCQQASEMKAQGRKLQRDLGHKLKEELKKNSEKLLDEMQDLREEISEQFDI